MKTGYRAGDAEISRAISEGQSIRSIAEDFGVAISTVHNIALWRRRLARRRRTGMTDHACIDDSGGTVCWWFEEGLCPGCADRTADGADPAMTGPGPEDLR